METVYLDMRGGIDAEEMRYAGSIIRRGGLVAFPTETVYGLGGNALFADASRKIYAAKGRPSDNPLIVHIADLDALWKIAEDIPEEALRLAEAFWPGPMTMVLKRSPAVPLETTGGLDTVAVRMPVHPAALALIREGGGYIAAPSANTSGRPSPTTAQHVLEDLGGKIDCIIDGGEVSIGVESSIIDLTGPVPSILRPGYISQDMFSDVIGRVEIDPGITGDNPDIRPKAPGMKYRHYAPKASLAIVEGTQEEVVRAIRSLCAAAAGQGKRAGVIASDETAGLYKEGIVRSAGTRADEITISRHLYGILREFDALGVDVIYSEAFDTPQLGQAIMNRLIKAAGHTILQAGELRNEGRTAD